jgi:hypothetical protein
VDEEDRRSERLRSFMYGALLGASAAVAAARRRRPMRGPTRTTPAGLAAFEDAPCYGETLTKEADAELR